MNEDNVTTVAAGQQDLHQRREESLRLSRMLMMMKKRDGGNKPMGECDHGFDLGGPRFVLLVSMPSLYKSR